MSPQIAPITAVFTMKITTCSGAKTSPFARVAYEVCHAANAMLVNTSTAVAASDRVRSEAHSLPRKKPSSVNKAAMTVLTAIKAKVETAFGHAPFWMCTPPNRIEIDATIPRTRTGYATATA